MTINEAIKSILEDDRCEISAELSSALNFSRSDHPVGRGKQESDRKLEAMFAAQQSKYIPVALLRNLEIANG